MKRTWIIVSMGCVLFAAARLNGQQKTTAKPVKAPAKLFVPDVYLGESDYKGGPIQKDRFSQLMKQGLTSHDSLGNHYKIVGFDFSYAERKVYEDSIGNLIKITDFLSEHYPGNMLGADLSTDADLESEKEVVLSLYQRVKPGDTLYIDHVQVNTIGRNSLISLPDSVPIQARGMRCVIVK